MKTNEMRRSPAVTAEIEKHTVQAMLIGCG
jgi:hypothetical protein